MAAIWPISQFPILSAPQRCRSPVGEGPTTGNVGRASAQAVTRVKLEQASKVKSWKPTRLRIGEAAPDREVPTKAPDWFHRGNEHGMREGDRSNCGKAALVNKVVSALMSGLPFKTSFKNGVELVKGFLDAAIDLVPAAVFQ